MYSFFYCLFFHFCDCHGFWLWFVVCAAWGMGCWLDWVSEFEQVKFSLLFVWTFEVWKLNYWDQIGSDFVNGSCSCLLKINKLLLQWVYWLILGSSVQYFSQVYNNFRGLDWNWCIQLFTFNNCVQYTLKWVANQNQTFFWMLMKEELTSFNKVWKMINPFLELWTL